MLYRFWKGSGTIWHGKRNFDDDTDVCMRVQPSGIITI